MPGPLKKGIVGKNGSQCWAGMHPRANRSQQSSFPHYQETQRPLPWCSPTGAWRLGAKAPSPPHTTRSRPNSGRFCAYPMFLEISTCGSRKSTNSPSTTESFFAGGKKLTCRCCRLKKNSNSKIFPHSFVTLWHMAARGQSPFTTARPGR